MASSLVSLRQALAVSAFDIKAEKQKIAELNDKITELDAKYLKAVFSSAIPGGFVAVYTPRYIESGSTVAER